MKQDDSTRQDNPKRSRVWLILLLVLICVLIGLWIWFTPSGFWGKVNALGYSVCHQITPRSFVLGDSQSPLCARCAGMYLGALVTLIAHFIWGKHGKFPPLWILIFLGLGLLAFALDGLNSAAGLILPSVSFYQTTNLTRLITGLAVGLGIGSVLAPIFNQTLWHKWLSSSAYEKGYRFPLLIAVLGIVGWAVYSQLPVFFYVSNLLMGLGILLTLWVIHTTLASFILKRNNTVKQWRDLVLPGLLGFVMVLAQIGLISLARYLLTGTWEPVVL